MIYLIYNFTLGFLLTTATINIQHTLKCDYYARGYGMGRKRRIRLALWNLFLPWKF